MRSKTYHGNDRHIEHASDASFLIKARLFDDVRRANKVGLSDGPGMDCQAMCQNDFGD